MWKIIISIIIWISKKKKIIFKIHFFKLPLLFDKLIYIRNNFLLLFVYFFLTIPMTVESLRNITNHSSSTSINRSWSTFSINTSISSFIIMEFYIICFSTRISNTSMSKDSFFNFFWSSFFGRNFSGCFLKFLESNCF